MRRRNVSPDDPSRHRPHKTAKSATRQRDKVFDMVVQGASIAQVADRLGVGREAVRALTRKPEFREAVERYHAERRAVISERLDVAGERMSATMIEIARGTREVNGSLVPIDPKVAAVQVSAAEAIFSRIGFPKATSVRSEHTGVVGVVGPSATDDDLARLSTLLGDSEPDDEDSEK